MAILKVSRMGHPVLRQKTQDFSKEEILSADTQRLVDDMVQTMHEYEGVGLAAPQVHINRRLLVVEVKAVDPKSTRPIVPLTALFNAHIVAASKETEEDWEGCLSIPGIRGLVPRHKWIEVEAFDRNGREISLKASGFFARVLQHEIDHLDGILFIDRMKDLRQLGYVEELNRFGIDDE